MTKSYNSTLVEILLSVHKNFCNCLEAQEVVHIYVPTVDVPSLQNSLISL